MARNNPFLFLKNKSTSREKFKKQRSIPKGEDEEIEPPKIPKPAHKARLRRAFILFNEEQEQRIRSRTIELPHHIDIIKIHFLTRFNSDLEKKFYKKYGLSILSYEDFNKTVLFSIDDTSIFKIFKDHLQRFFNSRTDELYEGQPYALIALIQQFYLLTSAKRAQDYSANLSSFSLIPFLNQRVRLLYKTFISYLRDHQKTFFEDRLTSNIEIAGISKDELKEILDNFDIVKSVTSSRTARIRPGAYGDVVREYGFTINANENSEIVGVIDTGVNAIEPLKPVLSGVAIDLTGAGAPYWDENGHGTMIAGLISLGNEFLEVLKREYDSKARIAVIKVIQQGSDEFSINSLVTAIRKVNKENGIRLFNLSLNDPIPKEYNSGYSDYAWLLDKLAYDQGIIIFISTGNIFAERVEELQNETHPSHKYPFHFYCLGKESDIHSCQSTNICPPAESLNNITIGALADNFETDYTVGITPAKEYPAYYTRKFHWDYTQAVNGTLFSRPQKNKHLNKPDIIYNGGDLFEKEAGIEVLTSPVAQGDKYFTRMAGSSIAAPLVASMAAQIASQYPDLNVQTIKAILLNSAELSCSSNPILFRHASHKGLLKKLAGLGTPKPDNLLFTSKDEITFVIEDKIKLEEIKSIELNLPSYLAKSGNKLLITGTLTYAFDPIRGNHLNYCPLQIVFGIFQGVDVQKMAEGSMDQYKIKNGPSWSDDFWPVENRLYSNVQHLDFYLDAKKLASAGNKVVIGIKCTGKKEIDAVYRAAIEKNNHPFSVALRLAEYPEARAAGKLYDEMIAINEVENIADLDLEAEIE